MAGDAEDAEADGEVERTGSKGSKGSGFGLLSSCDYNINISGGTSCPCHCGAKRCRGETIGDFFLLPIGIQREYRPLLADWFVRRHKERIDALDASTRSGPS